MSALLRTYSRNFERRPYLTLCVANGLLMSIGDVSAQIIGLSVRPSLSPRGQRCRPTERLTQPARAQTGASLVFDVERTMRYAVFGASMGPLGGAWNSASLSLSLAPLPPSCALSLTPSPARRVPRGQLPPAPSDPGPAGHDGQGQGREPDTGPREGAAQGRAVRARRPSICGCGRGGRECGGRDAGERRAACQARRGGPARPVRPFPQPLS